MSGARNRIRSLLQAHGAGVAAGVILAVAAPLAVLRMLLDPATWHALVPGPGWGLLLILLAATGLHYAWRGMAHRNETPGWHRIRRALVVGAWAYLGLVGAWVVIAIATAGIPVRYGLWPLADHAAFTTGGSAHTGLQFAAMAVPAIFALLFLRLPRHGRQVRAGLRYAVLFAAAVVILTPFAWLLCSAFRDKAIQQEYAFLPPPSMWTAEFLNLSNFRELLRPRITSGGTLSFWVFVLNSLFLACTTTIIHCLGCSLTGYALAKFDFKGRSWVMGFMLATMMIPAMIFLAPMYQIMIGLGWVDSYWPFIIPSAIPVFGVFLFRQAMLGVPDEMLEAARVDGAGELRLWWTMALPLTRPMAAAFCLVSFLGSWNNFIGPQIYLHSQELHTLPIVLNQYMDIYNDQTGVFLAGTLLAIIPPAIIFFALQREFVSGLSTGAVKG